MLTNLQGTVKWWLKSRLNQSSFDKFLNSLYTLGTLVRSDRQSKKSRAHTTAFHTWLGYDGDNFFLATGRDDDWSNALVDDCLQYYQLDAVNEWVSFTKSEEYSDNVRVVSEYYERTGGLIARTTSVQ